MAIDFCRAHHSPLIRSNGVSMDGYEVENLISSEEERRRKGFLAASFIRPPVEIIVTFPHTVDVSHIVLGLRNGSQHTSAVKLSTSIQDPAGNEAGHFNHIGSYENISESKICLANYRYRPMRLFHSFPQYKPAVSEIKRLYPKSDSAICRIRTLKICITRTSASSLPVLSELQIWGQPGLDCSLELKKMIYDIEQEESLKTNVISFEEQQSADEIAKKVTVDEENDDIPQEFLDSITYELMAQPVLLPSGNNVDRSTLEKYIDTSSAWGRLPGDPFTGVPFGPLSRPTSNVELKLRIDQFWLTNPHLCYGGRCVGLTNPSRLRYECENAMAHSKSRQTQIREDSLYNVHKSKYDLFESKGESKYLPCIPDISTFHSKSKLKSNRSIQNAMLTSQKQKSETSLRSNPLKRSASSEAPVTAKISKKSSALPHQMFTPREHMRELSSSLKYGLKQVLSRRPPFISSCEDTEKSKSRNCSICNCLHLHGAYRLPCSHTLCRSCLVRETTSAQPSCKTCNVSYLSSEVVRFYE